MIWNEIAGAILQLALFTLIPLLVYLGRNKKLRGFTESIGLKRSNVNANFLAVLASFVFSIPLLIVLISDPAFKELMYDESSITGKIRAIGFSGTGVFLVLLIALVKTSLSEEILFRGFIAKKLISWLGYLPGNIVQAIIFGVIHSLLFMSITDNLGFLLLIFTAPAIGSFVSVYLNEKRANGSIIPGWISHGLANVFAYSLIGFHVL